MLTPSLFLTTPLPFNLLWGILLTIWLSTSINVVYIFWRSFQNWIVFRYDVTERRIETIPLVQYSLLLYIYIYIYIYICIYIHTNISSNETKKLISMNTRMEVDCWKATFWSQCSVDQNVLFAPECSASSSTRNLLGLCGHPRW